MMNEIKNKKTIFSVVVIAILLIGVVGLTYAFFNYTRTGAANNIGTGRIYFNMVQNGAINMTNIFPMTSQEASNAELDSVVVRIAGDTTYSGGEEFEISLTDVTNTINGKKMPINYIATYTAANGKSVGEESNDYWNARNSKNADIYTLTETGSVEEGKQVLVGYIKNSASGIEGTLTIKAYIDADRIAISDTYDSTNPGTDNMGTTSTWVKNRTVLTTTEWNSFQNSTNQISFKIRAESNEGIWVEEPEPDNVTPASCFEKRLNSVYTLNTNMTSQELNDCVSYINTKNITFEDNVTAEDYCRGTGKQKYNGQDFQISLNSEEYDGTSYNYDYNYLIEHNIITAEKGIEIKSYNSECGGNIVIPSKMEYTPLLHNNNMTSEEINTCVSYFNDYYDIENYPLDEGETIEDYCQGTGTVYDRTFQQHIDDNYYFNSSELAYFKNNNIIVDGVTRKYPVVVLRNDGGYGIFDENLEIENIVLNNNLKIIGEDALSGAFLKNMTILNIPSSVIYIATESLLVRKDDYDITINILGNPYIASYALNDYATIIYGGTCQELHDRSNSSYIINGRSNEEFNVTTTDTNTCKVYAGNFG